MRGALATLFLLGACATTPGNDVARVSREFPLGASRAEVEAAVSAHCADSLVHEYRGAEAAPYIEQTQIDCLGYVFAGGRRKIELLINEGALGFYWILLTTPELENTRTALQSEFGTPTCITADYTIFESASTALRRDPAEILVATPSDFAAITGGC